jgi:hypothetical protein
MYWSNDAELIVLSIPVLDNYNKSLQQSVYITYGKTHHHEVVYFGIRTAAYVHSSSSVYDDDGDDKYNTNE